VYCIVYCVVLYIEYGLGYGTMAADPWWKMGDSAPSRHREYTAMTNDVLRFFAICTVYMIVGKSSLTDAQTPPVRLVGDLLHDMLYYKLYYKLYTRCTSNSQQIESRQKIHLH